MSFRRYHRTIEARRASLDLGYEPALSFADGRPIADRRQFNFRWLAGTFLTGIAGCGLMGGALLAAVDGQTRFTVAPRAARYDIMAEAEEGPPSAHKGDRLKPQSADPVRRHIIQIATTTHVGEKEIVRTIPYARVFAPLSLQRTSLSGNIPDFNPLRIFSDAGTPYREVAPPVNEADGELSLINRNFSEIGEPFADGDSLDGEKVLQMVRQTIAVSTGGFDSGTLELPKEGQMPADAVSENVTAVSKSENAAAEGLLANDDKEIAVAQGDTLATVLVGAGASLAEAQAIIEALSKHFKLDDLRPGQKLRYALSPAPTDANPEHKAIARVSVMSGRSILATAAQDESGRYMAIDSSHDSEEEVPPPVEAADEDNSGPTGPTLYVSLYETALRYGLPRQLIDELIKVYSYDFDFQRHVKPGDSFEVFYAAEEEQGATPDRGDILFAALTVGGQTKRFFRYKTDDDGITDFYDERGNSAKKFLMRKPMTGGVFTSGFGFRVHPIHGNTRMHTGVDWSAPIGTPVLATGTGSIVRAGWLSGYGQRIEVQHANGYMTTYNHLSSIAGGIQPGAKVHQGQVIGFVGSTGLSTGPHCHYEVLVNGSFVDPMRIKVPRGRVLEGRTLADFDHERDRIETMMHRAYESRLSQS